MTPLKTILDWFDAQDNKIKLDFTSIASHFHMDEKIELEYDEEKKIELFRKYINDVSLEPKEVIKRTLFLKSLFNLTMDGRDSEDGWEKSRKLNQIINDKMKSEGKNSSFQNNFMSDFTERKSKWIDWSTKWKILLSSNLSEEAIMNWYFSLVANK